MSFKLKVVAEAEAVENNSDIAREYRLSESMVPCWCKDQAKLFNGELKMSAKRTMGRFTPKYPELDQQILEWFTEQWEQGESSFDLPYLTKFREYLTLRKVKHNISRVLNFAILRGN